MIFLLVLKVCDTVVFFCAVSMKAHTQTNTTALAPPAILFASHAIVSALFLVSPSHTYGTQSQHLQPGFPPVWRVCGLGFPGHKHQGEPPLCTLALPLGQAAGLGWCVPSRVAGRASALRGTSSPCVAASVPSRGSDVEAFARHFCSGCPALVSSFQTPVTWRCNDLEVPRAPLCSWPHVALRPRLQDLAWLGLPSPAHLGCDLS